MQTWKGRRFIGNSNGSQQTQDISKSYFGDKKKPLSLKAIFFSITDINYII